MVWMENYLSIYGQEGNDISIGILRTGKLGKNVTDLLQHHLSSKPQAKSHLLLWHMASRQRSPTRHNPTMSLGVWILILFMLLISCNLVSKSFRVSFLT